MFASPGQPGLLPSSPCIDGFPALIIGLPQGRNKEGTVSESVSERVSEWSYDRNTSQAVNLEYPILGR